MSKTKTPSVAVAEIELIPIKQLTLNSYNPRKTISEVALEEMAESLLQKGQLQNIVVRPLPDENGKGPRFEVVCGERRYHAAKRAGLKELLARVVVLADAEALEWCIIENEQRDDVSVVEKAEGYYRYITDHGKTQAELAQSIGKTTAYVGQLLRLRLLPEAARSAVTDGRLPLRTAQVICRVPTATGRERFALHVLSGGHLPADITAEQLANATPLSVVMAEAALNRDYLRSLKDAAFSQTDKELYPEAGSCKACPKRAGNAVKDEPEVYRGVRADTCMDTACYAEKLFRHCRQRAEAARGSGWYVLEGEAAVMWNPHSYKWIPLDQPGNQADATLTADRTVRQLLEDHGPILPEHCCLVMRPDGTAMETVSRQHVQQLLTPPKPEPDHGPVQPSPLPSHLRLDPLPPPAPVTVPSLPPDLPPEPDEPRLETLLDVEERAIDVVLTQLRHRLPFITTGSSGRDALQALATTHLFMLLESDDEETVEALAYDRGLRAPHEDELNQVNYMARWLGWLNHAPAHELLLLLVEDMVIQALSALNTSSGADVLLALADTSWQTLVRQLGGKLVNTPELPAMANAERNTVTP